LAQEACIFVPDLILEGADARQSEAINIYCMATIMSSVKVYFSKFGISTSSLPKKQALYVPAAKITYTDKKRKSKTQMYFGSPITKKNYMGMIEGGSFFVIIRQPNIFHFFNSEGEQVAEVEINGKPIQVDEDNFIVRDGNTAIWYGADGNKISERQLTEEELKMFR